MRSFQYKENTNKKGRIFFYRTETGRVQTLPARDVDVTVHNAEPLAVPPAILSEIPPAPESSSSVSLPRADKYARSWTVRTLSP